MKKNALLLFVVLAVNLVFAQERKFGLKMGVNFSTLTGIDNTSSKIGLLAGAYANFVVGDNFSVQPELLFSNQGTQDSQDNGLLKYNLYYLNLPVMFQYFVLEGFYLQAGPQLSFLLAAKDKSDDPLDDLKDSFNTIDFGLNLGLGYKTESGISLDARYNLGLTNISKQSYGSVNNSVFQITLGYDILKP